MYDARGRTGANGGSGGSELWFGVGLVAVVLLSFLAVWKGPDLLSGRGGRGADPERARLAAVFPDERMQDVIIGMKNLDPAGYADFAYGLDRGDSPDAMQSSFTEWSELFYINNMTTLAGMDMKYLDEVLDVMIDATQDLSDARSSWCQGGTFIRMQTQSPAALERQMDALMATSNRPGTPLYDFNVEMNLIMVKAIDQSRRKPKRYGEMGTGDMITLASAFKALQKAPELRALQNRNASASDLANVDMCKLGRRFLKVFRSLPKDTKGRLWHTALSGKGLDSLGGRFPGMR